MNPKAYATIGSRLARKIFEAEGKQYSRHECGPSTLILTGPELAAMLALAVEEGWKYGTKKERR